MLEPAMLESANVCEKLESERALTLKSREFRVPSGSQMRNFNGPLMDHHWLSISHRSKTSEERRVCASNFRPRGYSAVCQFKRLSGRENAHNCFPDKETLLLGLERRLLFSYRIEGHFLVPKREKVTFFLWNREKDPLLLWNRECHFTLTIGKLPNKRKATLPWQEKATSAFYGWLVKSGSKVSDV